MHWALHHDNRVPRDSCNVKAFFLSRACSTSIKDTLSPRGPVKLTIYDFVYRVQCSLVRIHAKGHMISCVIVRHHLLPLDNGADGGSRGLKEMTQKETRMMTRMKTRKEKRMMSPLHDRNPVELFWVASILWLLCRMLLAGQLHTIRTQ